MDGILGEDVSKDIESIDKFFESLVKPKSFEGSESQDVLYTKNFEEMKIMIREHLNAEPETMVALTFLQSWEHLKKKFKAKDKKKGKK